MTLDLSHFVCQCCGNCCRPHGLVRITDAEITKIAAFLGMPEAEFIDRYTALCPDRRGLTLIEQESGACCFLTTENRCRIQICKPDQCKGFPDRWTDPLLESQCMGLKKLREEEAGKN